MTQNTDFVAFGMDAADQICGRVGQGGKGAFRFGRLTPLSTQNRKRPDRPEPVRNAVKSGHWNA